MELFLDFQNHIGYLVRGTVAVTIHTTYINISKVVIRSRLQGRHTHLRGSRLVVELDPQTADQFLGLVACQCTIGNTFLIEGEQMLVDMTRIHRVPAVEFGYGAKVYEPVHLNRLPQITRGMGRYPVTHIGNLLQLSLTLRILLFGSHLFCQFCMALSEENGCVAGDGHGLQFLLLVGSLGIIDIVERGNLLLDTCLHVEQSFVIHLAIHSRMTSGALFHKLGEHTGMVGFFPLFRHMVENALTLGLTLPVGDDLPFIGVDILLTDGITLQFTFVQGVQVFHRMTGQFREGRHSLRQRPAFADDQFVITDIQGLLLADLIEIPGTQHGDRHGAIVLLIEGGLNQRAFDTQGCGGVKILLTQALDALVHTPFVFWILNRKVHIVLIVFCLIYFFNCHRFLDGAQQSGTGFGHHIVQLVTQTGEVAPGIELVVVDEVHKLMLCPPLVHQFGDEIDTRLNGEDEPHLQRTGKTQRLEAELRALHLTFGIAHILFTQILHVMDIEPYHMTQAAREEQGIGA